MRLLCNSPLTIRRFSTFPVKRPELGATMKCSLDETSVRWVLAVLLALIAGYLDGYGLLALGTYVSFMSGNTTSTGLNIGRGHFDAALPSAIAVASFVSGSFLGNLMTQARLRRSHRMIFGLIAVILATIAGLDRRDPWNAPSEIAMLAVAMGMMNPALSIVGTESVSLTFVTGTLNRIGGHLAAVAGRKPLPGGQGPEDTHLRRARIDASIWLGFLIGASLSGIMITHFHILALLPACVVMIVLALFCSVGQAAPSGEKAIIFSTSGASNTAVK
jgi:uncharacterized membrane protein YoaK (UPF0700 family)